MGQPIPMLCAIGRSRCGSVQNLLAVKNFSTECRKIIVEDTPVTLFMGEDEQRPLAERVAKFLPRVNANYTIIDTKEHELKGISPEFRGQFLIW